MTKIATCSYCGTRALLAMRSRGRHELACGSCGAPLHEMKWLKAKPAEAPARPSAPARVKQKPRPPKPATRRESGDGRKRRRGIGYWLREALDEIEDLFD